MSELLNPGIVSLASVALSVVLLLVGLLLWFLLIAPVRAPMSR